MEVDDYMLYEPLDAAVFDVKVTRWWENFIIFFLPSSTETWEEEGTRYSVSTKRWRGTIYVTKLECDPIEK